MSERPSTGTIEARTAAVEVAERRIRGLIPYGVESRDLGGWTEIIEPTAFRDTKLEELRAVIDHAGVPLARYPQTLDVEDRADGLHWSLDPPRSRADVVEAIERGDVVAGSWRMRVGRDRWEGDVRHVEAIDELLDVTIVGAEQPAYPQASVEYRTTTGAERQEGATVALQDTGEKTAENEITTEERTASDSEQNTEQRLEPEQPSAGSLQVEERLSSTHRGLADEFRAAGFPGQVAEIPWETYEQRALTWSPSINLLSQVDRQGGPFPVDERYVWPVLPRVAVDSGVTSVQVLVQLGQDLATGVVRGIDASTEKAETSSTVSLQTVALSGVASIESGIPNVVLEQPQINTIIERDLRLAVNEGLDGIVDDTFAASDNQAPGSDPLPTSIRKAMTLLQGDGFNPDTVVLTPAAAETLDTLVSGISGGTADYVFAPGQFAPSIFGLRRAVSKVVAAPIVLDSSAYGRLYASPARLARFEENDGKTNTSLVRLDLHAACGVERQDAAVRIAAS